MVAEPILFLSADREVMVRAHVNKEGAHVYCIKDFIRQTSNKEMGPNDALVYWMSSLFSLQRERAITDVTLVVFPGFYEMPKENPCISAEGLLILFHHLDARFGLIKREYESEITQVLTDLISNPNAHEKHVEMFDDGVIEEQIAERQAKGVVGDMPPPGSKFLYVDNDDDTEKRELLSQLEAKDAELKATLAKLQAHETDRDAKRRLRCSFTVPEVISAMDIPEEHQRRVCRWIVSEFKQKFPDRKTFLRHRTTRFLPDDRPAVEAIAAEMKVLDFVFELLDPV